MLVLLIAAMIIVPILLYAADRVIKARKQTRRLRMMSDRLAAATARGEAQRQQRTAAAAASAELTSVMPAINRPPLTLRRGSDH